MDAFYRAMCPSCRKPKLHVQDDGTAIDCRGCGYREEKTKLVLAARNGASCGVCRLVGAVTSIESPRCILCQMEWESNGRPVQHIRRLVPERMACALHRLPRLSDAERLMDRIARYQMGTAWVTRS